MVADFDVFFDFGGTDATPGTEQDTDGLGPPNIRWKTADDATIDVINPVPIPGAGLNRSFWKQIYIKANTAPDTQVDNIQFFTDGGGYGTGITLRVGDQFPTKNSGSDAGYKVATGVVGTAGDDLVTNHAGITSVSDAFTFTSGSTLVGPSISEAGSIINAINETSNYLIFQAEVGTTATPGNKADETLTIQYDEI